WIVCSTSLTDGTGSPARSMGSTASVNTGTFPVCRSHPVFTQLRTWRCTAITNAMCEEEKCDLTARRSAIEGFYLPQVFCVSALLIGSCFRINTDRSHRPN